MNKDYSVGLLKHLKARFQRIGLHRPQRSQPYEVGDELVYDITGLTEARKARVHLVIDKFVGGGFAGQVYRVKLLAYESGSIPGLEVGQLFAMKILIPPSSFSLLFRNAVYFLGFQGAFQLQVNPAAARAGALWQKFIRRAAKLQFGDERSVVDIHATFVDSQLGSCGELSEWIDGRTWRLEVDDRLDLLKAWFKGRLTSSTRVGSPEFRAKRAFMRDFVKLLHEVGAHEFARQYEWSTCKSQPNCLKRSAEDADPTKGLVAVDFRAGLALLPFLPMSPGDFKLILTGLSRGSLVQFDRGDLSQLERYIQSKGNAFDDMRGMLEELKMSEAIYRDSVLDITHHGLKLLHSRRLWASICKNSARGWHVAGFLDEAHAARFERSPVRFFLFSMLGFIPILGRMMRKAWGRSDWRRHYSEILLSSKYFKKALKGRRLEGVMEWHRAGRVDKAHAIKIADSPLRFTAHLPLSILPVGLHRLLSDWSYAKERFSYLLVRPLRLYFDAKLREQWLQEMVEEGRRKHILNDEDAREIESQIKEPYIQKYLKSLVVHMCLMPTTHVVNLVVVLYYLSTHPGMSKVEAAGAAALITAAFQVTPISPGSLARGLYVLYLSIRERNFKDYNLAIFLSFFKYIGYLAFPIQMTYRYPTLARFMAGHWATEAVHIVPVFGEGGALLERKVFDLFYNWPLTLRRRMNKRAELRAAQKSRYVHVILLAVAITAIFYAVDSHYLRKLGALPTLKNIWWAAILLPFLGGATVTLGAGGASFNKRIVSAVLCGVLVGIFSTLASIGLRTHFTAGIDQLGLQVLWRFFIYSIFSTLGALLTELLLPEPE